MKKIKDKSIAFQIWIVISSMIILVIIILVAVSVLTYKNFLYNTAYQIIVDAQNKILDSIKIGNDEYKTTSTIVENYNTEKPLYNIIYPITASENIDNILSEKDSSEALWNKVLNQYQNQNDDSQGYDYTDSKDNMVYVITKYDFNGKSGFIFSYTKELRAANTKLYKQFARRMLTIMVIAVLISLVVARTLARYLSKPIMNLKENVEKIGQKEWDMPITVDRKDEIGELSKSIEFMRQCLIKSDQDQQWMLQNISHELKTPVMVIRSYAQSVGDGIFPKGDLSSTMLVIDSEAERLEKRIRDLLYLTKIDYLLQHKRVEDSINMKDLIENTVDRFKFKREQLDWNLNLENIIIAGDYEQFKIVVENILENAIRYSKSKIRISLMKKDDSVLLKIYNDGESIEESLLKDLFEPFKKGKKGKFGLGITITKRIVDSYNGQIWADNETVGVSFIVSFLM